MNTESIDISLSSKRGILIIGSSAILSANDEYFTITATDSSHAGKYDKTDLRVKANLFSLRVNVRVDDDENFFINAHTKETAILHVTILGFITITTVGVFVYELIWWIPVIMMLMDAFLSAYLVQKVVYIRGLLR